MSFKSLSRSVAAAAVMVAVAGSSFAAEKIEFIFPTAVQGKLAMEMQNLIKKFNGEQSDVEVVGVYAGNYDKTKIKAQAAAEAGKPPAVVLMSANFIGELAMNDLIVPMSDLMAPEGIDSNEFIQDFWPAARPNAIFNGELYAVPYQNSTPILYYNKDHFDAAGITEAPKTWAEWVDVAQKVSKPDGERWGIMMASNLGYITWLAQGLVMSNGGHFFNSSYPGEVYFDQPSTKGAMKFWSDLVHEYKVMPSGVTPAKQVSTAFFAEKTSMMVLSTGSLSHVRDNAKFNFGVAFVPGNVANGVPIGGASLISFKGTTPEQKKAAWTFISWLSTPENMGHWSRFTGYFSPLKTAYDLPEMDAFIKANPSALTAVQQLEYAGPWFATAVTVASRQAFGNQMQALLSDPTLSIDEAATKAQAQAEEILKPYNDKMASDLIK